MARSYSPTPVPDSVLRRVLDVAMRGPSAGFTQGVDLLVLEGNEQTQRFFELTSDPKFLGDSQALQGLTQAPLIVVPLCDPIAYVSRYAEADKVSSALSGLGAERWPVPYWLVDSSFAVMLLLLAATDEGLGALFFQLHRSPGALFEAFGVPETKLAIGAVALGYEAAPLAREVTGSPARRPRRTFEQAVHFGSW